MVLHNSAELTPKETAYSGLQVPEHADKRAVGRGKILDKLALLAVSTAFTTGCATNQQSGNATPSPDEQVRVVRLEPESLEKRLEQTDRDLNAFGRLTADLLREVRVGLELMKSDPRRDREHVDHYEFVVEVEQMLLLNKLIETYEAGIERLEVPSDTTYFALNGIDDEPGLLALQTEHNKAMAERLNLSLRTVRNDAARSQIPLEWSDRVSDTYLVAGEIDEAVSACSALSRVAGMISVRDSQPDWRSKESWQIEMVRYDRISTLIAECLGRYTPLEREQAAVTMGENARRLISYRLEYASPTAAKRIMEELSPTDIRTLRGDSLSDTTSSTKFLAWWHIGSGSPNREITTKALMTSLHNWQILREVAPEMGQKTTPTDFAPMVGEFQKATAHLQQDENADEQEGGVEK